MYATIGVIVISTVPLAFNRLALTPKEQQAEANRKKKKKKKQAKKRKAKNKKEESLMIEPILEPKQ